MKIEKLKLNKDIKHRNEKVILNAIKNSSGVYILYNKRLEVIYVGKTEKFRTRLLSHVSPNNLNNNTSIIPRGEVTYFYFIKLKDEFDKMVSELYLIRLMKPKYNFIKKRGKATKNFKSNTGGWA